MARRGYACCDGCVGLAGDTADISGSVFEPCPSLSLTFHRFSAPTTTAPHLIDPETDPILPEQRISSKKIHTFDSTNGSSSFWRFIIEIPLQHVEMTVRYRLNGGAAMDFVVPAIGQNFHWAAHSCNGG
jgi:hypothetical protein